MSPLVLLDLVLAVFLFTLRGGQGDPRLPWAAELGACLFVGVALVQLALGVDGTVATFVTAGLGVPLGAYVVAIRVKGLTGDRR
jgi:hypothetical protein